MWIHESFTNYAENLFVEYYYGKEAGSDYCLGTRKRIRNDRPIVGIYNVNNEGSGDMYYKGGNMFHTLRQIVNDDTKWREILRGINKDFYHQVVTGAQIENYLSEKTGTNLKPFFDQYLRDVRIPVFEYYIKNSELFFRWNNCVPGFNMPMRITVSGDIKELKPTSGWTSIKVDSASHEIKTYPGYYVAVLNIMGK
jgi:aminopeptidase N